MRTSRILLGLLLGLPLWGHVGSPDVYYEGNAGPYHLLVTIRPPLVVPGVAEVEIRSSSPDVRQIHIVPLQLGIQFQQFPPVPDLAKPTREDPQFYTGGLWLMATGSWQVRIDVDGAQGPARVSVPVPALATKVSGMSKAIAAALIPLGLVLCVGLISIVGAAVREGMLDAGKAADTSRKRRAMIAMGVTATIVGAVIWLGNSWWGSEAGYYSRIVFKPLRLKAELASGGRMNLQLDDPGWLNRKTDDLLPDHGHLMHLYVIKLPEMDRVWHLHPERGDGGVFTQQLPDMPGGAYALYGDIVHANGIAETATTEIGIPPVAGAPLQGDDAGAAAPPLSSADVARSASDIGGGYRMVWTRPEGAIRAKRPYEFKFALQDASGKPAERIELYMGMLGHAAFVSADRSVFAHVHPSGSVPMPALALAAPENPHAGHTMLSSAPPPEVSFPYGFPKAGRYRVFVQMKRAGAVATGAFDVQVE